MISILMDSTSYILARELALLLYFFMEEPSTQLVLQEGTLPVPDS